MHLHVEALRQLAEGMAEVVAEDGDGVRPRTIGALLEANVLLAI